MPRIPKSEKKAKDSGLRRNDKIAVIEHEPGTKYVKRSKSWTTWVKRIFWIISVIWLLFAAWFPLHVKNNYSQPIKKSIVVSMFFDLQRVIEEQYERLLKGIADSIDLKKPVAAAIDKVKIAQGGVDKVQDTTAKAKAATDGAKKTTGKIAGIAGKFGVNTAAIDNTNKAIDSAAGAVAKVDDTAKLVNDKLDKVEKELEKIAQTEIDKALDEQIKKLLDSQTGGLGTTLLTNYGIKHVMPWKPSTWPITTKIYNDLERSNVVVIKSLTAMVDKYFGYVMWGIVVALWIVGLYIWMMVFKKMKALISPFIVCPRCGYTFADKRTAYSLLKVLQPWKWL